MKKYQVTLFGKKIYEFEAKVKGRQKYGQVNMSIVGWGFIR